MSVNKNYVLSIVFFLSFCTSWAQIGIKTTNPLKTLDVAGDVKIDQSLFLENPGAEIQIRDAKLLVRKTNNGIIKYDIGISKYGPINHAEFAFMGLNKNGLHDYDTKISIDDYLVTVQGFYFKEAGSTNYNVVLNSTVDNDNIEGYQFYAYKNTSTNTWFLKGLVNDSIFRESIGTITDTQVDLFLNLIIYRSNFITKEHTPIIIDMGNVTTGSAPLPAGF